MNEGLQIWALKSSWEVTDSEEGLVLPRCISRVAINVRSTTEPLKPVAWKLQSEMEGWGWSGGKRKLYKPVKSCRFWQGWSVEERAWVTLYGERWSRLSSIRRYITVSSQNRTVALFVNFELWILRSVKPRKTTCWIPSAFFWVNNMKSLHCLTWRGKRVRSLFVFYLLNKLFLCMRDLAAKIVPWALSYHSICREEMTGFIVWFNTKVQVSHFPDIHKQTQRLFKRQVSCLSSLSSLYLFFSFSFFSFFFFSGKFPENPMKFSEKNVFSELKKIH